MGGWELSKIDEFWQYCHFWLGTVMDPAMASFGHTGDLLSLRCTLIYRVPLLEPTKAGAYIYGYVPIYMGHWIDWTIWWWNHYGGYHWLHIPTEQAVSLFKTGWLLDIRYTK